MPDFIIHGIYSWLDAMWKFMLLFCVWGIGLYLKQFQKRFKDMHAELRRATDEIKALNDTLSAAFDDSRQEDSGDAT